MPVQLTPDAIVYWQWGPVVISATLVFTWVVMALLVIGSWLITRDLTPDPHLSRKQSVLESLVSIIRDQINDVTDDSPDRYLPFIGTLFLFISVSNLLVIVPGYHPPTGSLSTALALALSVFIAIPFFTIVQRGVGHYLRSYLDPSPFMLPFRIISELSRTFALAVRLFGNILSGNMIVAILVSIVPLLVPVVLQLLGLVIGQIQAYIFAVLALVYIASATRAFGDEAEGVTVAERDQRE